MYGFSLTYHRFGLFEREAFLRLQAFGEYVVSNSNDKSISDHLGLECAVVAVLGQLVQCRYVALGALSFQLVSFVEPSPFEDSILAHLEERIKLFEDFIVLLSVGVSGVRRAEHGFRFFS